MSLGNPPSSVPSNLGPAVSEHFTAAELACHHCGLNCCSPQLVSVLETFRTLAGNKPVNVHDAYRCMVHNAQVGGKPRSEHLMGIAADISIDGMTAIQLESIARRIPEIRGIGRADAQNYIHIDLRSTPAQWCYDAHGDTVPYRTPDQVRPDPLDPSGNQGTIA